MRTTDPARVQRIIDTAAKLFAQRHYHEVRMDDIAAQAEVAKGTLYLHFKTKEDLYLALILAGGSRLLERLQEQVSGPGTPEDKLQAFVAEVVRFFDCYPYFLELVQRVEGMQPPCENSPLQANRARFFKLLTGLLQEFQASGCYAVPDPQLSALALMGMVKEILRFQPRPYTDCLAGWMVSQFLHGLRGLSGPASA